MKKTAYYLFLFALIFSPMAFGTVEIWSYLILEVIICASALLFFYSSKNESLYQCPGILPLILVNAFLLFQVIPLPGYFVKILSPSTYDIYQSAAGLTGNIGWLPISIYPRATLMELLRFATYVLFYIIAIQFLADRSLLKKTIAVIAGFAALLSLVAIIEFITESLNYPLPHDKIFWFKELSHGGTPMGPYVNRNHYAGLMEMIFPLALSMFLAYRPRIIKLSFKKKIAAFFNQKRINQHFFYGTAAILIATSVLMSLSRGGILSLSISMIIFSALVIFKAKQKKAGLFIGFIVIIILFLTGTSGWDAIFKRFESLQNQSGLIYDNRLIIWEDSLKIIQDFPLVGTGTGTLEKIYPLYRSFPGDDVLEHAHNDFLEFFCTGGIILPVLMSWCLFSILYPSAESFIKRREWSSILLFTGCITSVSAILIHSFVDFNMQIGANGLYFFLVLALIVSAANTRMRPRLGKTYLKKLKRHPYLVQLSAIILLISSVYVHGGTLFAGYQFSKYRDTPLTPDTPPKILLKMNQAAKTAAAFDIMSPEYTHIVARTALLLKNDPDALKHFNRAIRMDPINSEYLTDSASFLYQQKKYDLAEKFFLKSIQYNQKNMAAYIKYAAMLFEIHQAEKSFTIMKQAISVDTQVTNTCLALMVLNQIDDDRFHLALPDMVEPYLVLGNFFKSMGDHKNAERTYLNALEFLPNETEINKNYFLHVYRFFRNNEQYEKALHVILKAIAYFPDGQGLHHTAGDLYKKLGIDYRAEEEYRKAQILKQTLKSK